MRVLSIIIKLTSQVRSHLAYANILLLLPSTALADNCASLNDCWGYIVAAVVAAIAIAALVAIVWVFVAGAAEVAAITVAAEEAALGAVAVVAEEVLISAFGEAGLTESEIEIAVDAQVLLNSAEFASIRTAGLAGEEAEAQIGKYFIQNAPEMPASAMTWAEENGFTLGQEAWTSNEETIKTILQELYRLNTSEVIGAQVDAASASAETRAAFEFAEKVWSLIKW